MSFKNNFINSFTPYQLSPSDLHLTQHYLSAEEWKTEISLEDASESVLVSWSVQREEQKSATRLFQRLTFDSTLRSGYIRVITVVLQRRGGLHSPFC